MKAKKLQLEPTEADLVQQGDLDALVARWWTRIRRWCLMELGSVPLAEDASQEVVVRLLRLSASYTADRPFGPWLRTVVRNACHDVRARGVRRHPDRRQEPEWPGVERALDLGRSAELALQCLAELPESQREILDLCHRRGLSPAQAAVELGINAAAARALLYRARRELRARLSAHREAIVDLLREP